MTRLFLFGAKSVVRSVVSVAVRARLWAAVLALPLIAATCDDDGRERVGDLSLSAAALNDYGGQYAMDATNKAFAMSPDGAYAAAHSYPTEALAAAAALLNCNGRVPAGQLECLVYDINGAVVAQAPVRLRRR